MPRTIVMGDPAHFSVLGGANPHTRNALGIRKRVDPELAQIQWHELARTMLRYGAEVCVIEPHRGLTGLVYPANAGFLYPLVRSWTVGWRGGRRAQDVLPRQSAADARARDRSLSAVHPCD